MEKATREASSFLQLKAASYHIPGITYGVVMSYGDNFNTDPYSYSKSVVKTFLNFYKDIT